LAGAKFCQNCGEATADLAVVCVKCGVALAKGRTTAGTADKRLPAALTAILLPGLGIHKFILGYQRAGLTMLLVSVLTLGIGWFVMAPISVIEGIIYLTKSDDDFVATYVDGSKPWF
jgi:TM2 domain-containing membrane protein YozV